MEADRTVSMPVKQSLIGCRRFNSVLGLRDLTFIRSCQRTSRKTEFLQPVGLKRRANTQDRPCVTSPGTVGPQGQTRVFARFANRAQVEPFFGLAPHRRFPCFFQIVHGSETDPELRSPTHYSASFCVSCLISRMRKGRLGASNRIPGAGMRWRFKLGGMCLWWGWVDASDGSFG